jgi:hypothetical protein
MAQRDGPQAEQDGDRLREVPHDGDRPHEGETHDADHERQPPVGAVESRHEPRPHGELSVDGRDPEHDAEADGPDDGERKATRAIGTAMAVRRPAPPATTGSSATRSATREENAG